MNNNEFKLKIQMVRFNQTKAILKEYVLITYPDSRTISVQTNHICSSFTKKSTSVVFISSKSQKNRSTAHNHEIIGEEPDLFPI